jgi:hypothetical protein
MGDDVKIESCLFGVDYPNRYCSCGYEVVGVSHGSKVWTDGRVEFKSDVQMSEYNYNVMVLGFR